MCSLPSDSLCLTVARTVTANLAGPPLCSWTKTGSSPALWDRIGHAKPSLGEPPPVRDKSVGAGGGRESFQTEVQAWPLPREGRKERGLGGKGLREAGESLAYTHGEASKGCLMWESPIKQHPAWPRAAPRECNLDVDPRAGALQPGSKAPLQAFLQELWARHLWPPPQASRPAGAAHPCKHPLTCPDGKWHYLTLVGLFTFAPHHTPLPSTMEGFLRYGSSNNAASWARHCRKFAHTTCIHPSSPCGSLPVGLFWTPEPTSPWRHTQPEVQEQPPISDW